ncbi:hypothetical protein [Streptomyces bacillaris]|uniref:hypothetical protein n=1 Tax=Streptomyces bacillaris TaxID=68179 RepID=UPI00380C6B69
MRYVIAGVATEPEGAGEAAHGRSPRSAAFCGTVLPVGLVQRWQIRRQHPGPGPADGPYASGGNGAGELPMRFSGTAESRHSFCRTGYVHVTPAEVRTAPERFAGERLVEFSETPQALEWRVGRTG